MIYEENIRRVNNNIDVIDTEKSFDEFAKKNNIQRTQELKSKYEDLSLHDLLCVDMRRYVDWNELLSLCKHHKSKLTNEYEKYEEMRKHNIQIPKDPSIVYQNKFNSFSDLFVKKYKKKHDYDLV